MWAAVSHVDLSRIAALDEPFVVVTSAKADPQQPQESISSPC